MGASAEPSGRSLLVSIGPSIILISTTELKWVEGFIFMCPTCYVWRYGYADAYSNLFSSIAHIRIRAKTSRV